MQFHDVIEGAVATSWRIASTSVARGWSVDGAEAVLKLRALWANQDFPAYWLFHLSQERQQVLAALYANNVIPEAA